MKTEGERQQIKLPRGLVYVPDNIGGIYYFTFRLPSNYELGLLPENGEREMASVLNILHEKLDKIALAYSSSFLKGVIKENKQAHLAKSFSVESFEEMTVIPSEILSSISIKDSYEKLAGILSLIRKLLMNSPPIYIGITSKQTLQDRLRQHLDGQTGMKASLEQLGFGWQDVGFAFEAINILDDKELRAIEKTLQLLNRPIFSKA